MRSNRKGSSTAKPVTEAFSTPGLSTAPVAGGERVHMTYLESRRNKLNDKFAIALFSDVHHVYSI